MLYGIKALLGKESLQYMIVVFSKCKRKQTETPELLEDSWDKNIHEFVNSVGWRWAISPNPDIFEQDHPVHKQHIDELKSKIVTLKGIYTNDILKDVKKRQEEAERRRMEEEEKRKREYDEIKKKEGEARAEVNFLKQKREEDERLRLEEEREFVILVHELNKRINDLSEENRSLRSKNEEGCLIL